MNNTVERLRASRMRVTSGRIFVLQAIEQAAKSNMKKLRVEDIFRELVNNGTPLSLGSVYRVLKELTQEGILVRAWDREHDEQKFSYWMQPDAGPGAEHRICCSACGQSARIEDPFLAAEITRAGERAGLAPAGGAVIVIQVVCAACATKPAE